MCLETSKKLKNYKKRTRLDSLYNQCSFGRYIHFCQKPAQLRGISEDQEYQGLLLNKSTKLHQKPDLLCNAAFTQQYPLAKMQKIATSNFVVCIVFSRDVWLPFHCDCLLTAIIDCWLYEIGDVIFSFFHLTSSLFVVIFYVERNIYYLLTIQFQILWF